MVLALAAFPACSKQTAQRAGQGAVADSKIPSESQAETEMKGALQKLMVIRQEYNLPKKCS